MNIQINVTNKHATVVGAPVIVCGNSGYSLQFAFDAEWDAETKKTARFVWVQNGAVVHHDVEFTADTCSVPVLSNVWEVRVGVYAGDLRTSTPAVIPCELSILCGSGEAATAPTPSQYEEIMARLVTDTTLTKSGAPADAAAVGDAIKNMFEKETEITLSAYPGYNVIIGETAGTWGSGSDRVTYFVPVGDAVQIDVTANSNAVSVIALLKTDAHTAGTKPDYATGGYRMVVGAGKTVNLPVPDDCRYIAIMGLTKGVDYSPASVVLHTPVAMGGSTQPPIGLHTMPENEGVLNCIKRCRQLTDIKWTPMRDIPRWSWQTGGYLANGHCDDREDVFKTGVEYTGIPYARANKGTANYGYNYFHVGADVDFGTFVTAVREPNSVMQESEYSLSSKWACMYGVVCSTLACYAYNISYKATSSLPGVSGMSKIGDLIVDGARMDATLIKLGDMLIEAGNHVGVITDIMTDASGDVIAIEVSEATTAGNGNLSRQGTQYGGLCRRKGWQVDEFFSWWKNYSIYRYGNIAGIPYTPSPFVNVGDELPMMPQIDYACLPYMGEGFKYKVGKIHNSTIVIGVEGFAYLRVKKDGEYFGEPIAINGETYVDAGFTEAGSYSAYLCNMSGDAETNKTGACHWTVV